jgi:hypothetical protein
VDPPDGFQGFRVTFRLAPRSLAKTVESAHGADGPFAAWSQLARLGHAEVSSGRPVISQPRRFVHGENGLDAITILAAPLLLPMGTPNCLVGAGKTGKRIVRSLP